MRASRFQALTILTCLFGSWFAAPSVAAEFTPSWSEPQAEVLPTGDLRWKPHPALFQAGRSLRYIDYDGGNDTNPGSRDLPWKHHPWDPNAKGKAAAATGVDTYVFRGGVMYRGSLSVKESGEPGQPIRLTSDPAWGMGAALIVGSERVTGWKQGANHADIPQAQRVWWTSIDFAPRNVWLVGGDGRVKRLPLARTPNWQVSDADDIKSEWFRFNNPDRNAAWGLTADFAGTIRPMGVDTVNLKRDADYYEGALIWSEYGWVMGTPYPSRVVKFDRAKSALIFGGQWGSGAGSHHFPRHTRYYLEDKPHYLDDNKQGEFWFDKQGTGGRLYVRMPGDADPNRFQIEAAKRIHLIDSEKLEQIEISGLGFRFTNVLFDLDALPANRPDVDPACIRLRGSGREITIANCDFQHIHMPIRLQTVGEDAAIDGVVIRDNVIGFTDHGGMVLQDGGGWGVEYPKGRLYDVKILRNRLHQIGQRPSRYGQGHAIEVHCAETLEVAGNCLDRLYGAGIFVYGGKENRAKVDRPLTRILIHHNKVEDSLLNNNDWGGIETWQGGPAYVFDNISGNPGGFKLWGHLNNRKQPANSRFGHAFYMDGGYKQYYFNNIAWGKSNDPFDKLGNTSAFQEIHGYACNIFNNTIYNFVIGSRRQAPVSGRNKYMGNIWDNIGHLVFRHADPKDVAADPNAADAGAQPSAYHHNTNVYAHNVFHNLPERVAVFEPSGRWHGTVDGFRQALALRGSIGEVGEVVGESPLQAPATHDFRPTKAAVDKGVRVFVPWGLYATVAEWDFLHAGDDPALIPDDHLYLQPGYIKREDYYKQPTWPLQAVNVSDADFVEGPLEDWGRCALQLNGRDQYAAVKHALLDQKGTVDQGKPVTLKNKPDEKILFEAPEAVTAGEAFEVKIRLNGVDKSLKLQTDLHWQRQDGRFGGVNRAGGKALPVDGEGPYVFRFTPQAKPNLAYYIVTAFLTPTGDWKDHVAMAQWKLAPAAAVAQTATRSASIITSNFLIEAYFRTEAGHTGGLLVEKRNQAGYSLSIAESGALQFGIAGTGKTASVESKSRVNDGKWHHVIAEADRQAKQLTLYIDGRRDATADGLGPVSLVNDSDLYVGGRPDGKHFAGTIDFIRISLGTLADAKTTIDELYAWEFDGPFLRDFTGRKPTGRRDAGAIEGVN